MNLFYTKEKNPVSDEDLFRALDRLEAWDTEYLYIHTGLTFGLPDPSIKKMELLDGILNTLMQLGVKNICFPTFTFSFCNGQTYDHYNSKSKMGAINEYARIQPGAVRSVDPLMSSVLIGQDLDLVQNISKDSIGKGSTFDKLHAKKNVKFLFLGTKVGDCFTYMHYIEKMLNVDYRYDRRFQGEIIEGEKKYTDSFELFVRYKNIYAGKGSYTYEDLMFANSISQRETLGDSTITILDEKPAYDFYVDLITKDPYFFLDREKSKFDFDKTFEVKDMVAL